MSVTLDPLLIHPKTRVMLSPEQIAARVAELGAEISRDFAGEPLIVVCILKGSLIFFCDLVRHLNLPAVFDTLQVSSYHSGTESTGEVKIVHDLSISIQGRDVLLVEDIVDTGLTMSHLTELLGTRHPKSLRICSLLDKPSRRKVTVDIAYTGFSIPDEFVVGYGLDYGEFYRNLPYVGVLEAIPALPK
jgi:hypoxanthine phosphoribosyltransferase